MSKMSRQIAGLFVAACCAASSMSPALAQSSTIKLIIPLSAGGPNDTVGRLAAEHITRNQGVTMIVENRPGAGSVIGTEVVARSAPDGNTLLVAAGSFLVNPHIKKLSYDPLTSFEPICYLARSPHLIVTPASSPYKTFQELIAAAKQRPGELMFAANGPGTSQHIELEMIKAATGANITFVPFSGDAPTLNALLGDQISVGIVDLLTAYEYVKIGKLRVLAVGTPERLNKLPDIPSVAELGFPGSDWVGTLGVVAPAGTPKDKVEQLIGWFKAAINAPDVLARFDQLGLYPMGLCGADYATYMRTKFDENGRVIRASSIKAE